MHQDLDKQLKFKIFMYTTVSWFRIVIPPFSVSSHWESKTILCPLTSLPLTGGLREKWSHKRQRSQVEIRTIYWKEQWVNKSKSNSYDIKNKSVQGRECRDWPDCSHTTQMPPSGWDQWYLHWPIYHNWSTRKGRSFQKQKSLSSIPGNYVRWYWLTSGSWPWPHARSRPHSLTDTAKKINPILGQTQDIIHPLFYMI